MSDGIGELHPSKLLMNDDFLTEGDFIDEKTGKHREWKLEISNADREDLQSPGQVGTKKKEVLHFKGRSKRLPLNATNKKALISMFGGNKVKEWFGREVVVMWTTNELTGNKRKIRNPETGAIGGIRVKKA